MRQNIQLTMLRKIPLIFILISIPWMIQAQKVSEKDVPVKKKFIQILSSYTYENNWDTSIAKNICTKIEQGNPEISVTASYAGIGRRSSFLAERFAMQGAFSSGRLNATTAIPDVLVLVGDESWMFYRVMDLRGLWEKIPVVLCGMSTEIMNDYSRFFPKRIIADSLMIPLQESLKGLPATGVMLRDNTGKTVEMMKQLLPGLHEVVFLSNRNYQDILAEKSLQKTLAQHPDLTLQTLIVDANNADSVRQVVDRLPSTSAILVNMLDEPETSVVPVFSLRDSNSKNKTFVGTAAATIEEISAYTSQIVLRLYSGEPAESIPFAYADETIVLNKESVYHFELESRADKLQGVTYRNIPPPFILRYVRIIAFLAMSFIILFFSILIYIRSRANSRRLKVSLHTFRQLYNKYQAVYKNMPLGLISLDKNGSMLQRNEGADVFLSHFSMHTRDNFNLFRSVILNNEEQQSVRQGVPLVVVKWMDKSCFRFIFRPIQDEETGENNILMIVTEITEIEQARIEKEKIYEMLNFAMNASKLGVAEYNLVNGKGFATQAWYDNLGLKHTLDDLLKSQKNLLPAYQQKLTACMEQLRNGAEQTFLEIVEVQFPTGEKHWIRYLVQLMEYAPERGRIMVAELTYNIDEQVVREQELTIALKKARETDRLKNAFIANMRDEIRIPLNEIIRHATLMTQETDPNEMMRLNERIEEGNQALLSLINQLIEVSTNNDE